MKLRWVLVVLVAAAILGMTPKQTLAQQYNFDISCTDVFSEPNACRIFKGNAESQSLSFEAYWFADAELSAQLAVRSIDAGEGMGDEYVPEIPFGQARTAFTLENVNDIPGFKGVMVAFAVGDFLAIWISAGLADDPLTFLADYYESLLSENVGSLPPHETFWHLLPEADELPGFSLDQEFLEDSPFTDESAESAPEPTEPSQEDLMATIEALEQRVIELEAREAAQPTVAPTPIPTRQPTQESNSLEIVDTSSRDAGIGDGSAYIYADLYNGTSDYYSFITLSATCKDSVGSTVGTAVGIAQNVAPGQTVTVTMIMLSVPTCYEYIVRIDSAF